jgi:uncharacterized repeat protein (TIGR03803 family)
MKTRIRNLYLLRVLLVSLGLLLAGRVTAQTFTNVYNFTATSHNYPYTNSDGIYPWAGLILSGNTLYGTAEESGLYDYGTVFAVNTDGTGFRNLHNFSNGDGAFPIASLILSGNTLYGTARNGGSLGSGIVFKVNTNGTGFAILHNFTNYPTDGSEPSAGLILSGNTLYGTAHEGGTNYLGGEGSIFKVNTDGTGYKNLHFFTLRSGSGVNFDGASSMAGLILSGSTLYGTAYYGGNYGYGTIFAVNTDGTGFTTLHSFSGNNDGASPYAGLVLSGNTLYGTTYYGGSSSNGTVFAVNTDGTGFRNLHSFSGSDGANPYAGLILSGNTLYGTAGNVFKIYTDGTGFTVLNTGAAGPGGLILSSNILYGTSEGGGIAGNGAIFALSLPVPPTPPPFGITSGGGGGNQFCFSWPTNATGFALQSTTNLSSGIWFSVTNGIIVSGTNFLFCTNTAYGSAAFFRLKQ